MPANHRRRNLFLRGRHALAEICIDTENLTGADHVREEARDDLVVHGRTHREDAHLPVGQPIAILGRHETHTIDAAPLVHHELQHPELFG